MARRGWDSFLAEHNRMIYPHNNNAWETLCGHHQKLRAAMPNSISFTLFRPFLFKNLKKIYIFKLLVFGVVFECQCYFFHQISSFQFCCRRLDAQKIAHYFLSLSNLEHFPADVPLCLCDIFFCVDISLFVCSFTSVTSLCAVQRDCVLFLPIFLFLPVEKMCTEAKLSISHWTIESERTVCVYGTPYKYLSKPFVSTDGADRK